MEGGEYTEEFLETLKKLVDPKEITHIVTHHTEPDHSGAIPALLEANGYRAKLIGTTFAKRFMEGFYGKKVVENFHAIKDGEEMRIGGDGHSAS